MRFWKLVRITSLISADDMEHMVFRIIGFLPYSYWMNTDCTSEPLEFLCRTRDIKLGDTAVYLSRNNRRLSIHRGFSG